MKIYKLLSIIFLSILLYSCGSNSGHKKSDFTITTNAKKNKLSINDVLKLSIENKKNHNIDSVIYLLDNKKITEETNLQNNKLGEHLLEAIVYFANEKQTATKKIAIVLGNEVKGVQQEVVSTADYCVEIPQFGTKHSLNISVSTGVVLWDLFKKFKY